MKDILALAAVFILPPSSFILAQGGSLTPPGAPAPTMKTLQQIEPRADLQATPAPSGVDTANANYHFVINQPGSYYLSANLAVTKTNGIRIEAAGVTLDLNGFQISRGSGTLGYGVEVTGNGSRATILNGSCKGFGVGFRVQGTACALRDLAVSECSSNGISGGPSNVVEGCRAHDNSGDGIVAGNGSALSHCAAHNNAGLYGISVGPGSTISHCAAYNNTASYGINADVGSVLSHCVAYDNTGTYGIYAGGGSALSHCAAHNNFCNYGIGTSFGVTLTQCSAYTNSSDMPSSAGIVTGSGCTISQCTVRFNTSLAVATATTGMGISAGASSTVERCTVSSNRGSGIYVSGDRVQVTGNTCADNTGGGQGGGIHLGAGANGCRVDGNHSTGGVRGLFMEGTDNLIIRNSAQGATTANYDIVAGNHDAARVTSPGAAFASTSPWVNFSY